MTIIDRVQIATGIPDWEPLSDTDQDALFCVCGDARWRVERVADGWEVEIRTLGDRRIFGGADLERALADAVRWLGRDGMSELLDVEQVRAMATPAGSLWAGERAPTALALARTALDWFARWSTVHAAEEARDLAIVERDEAYRQRDEALEKVRKHLEPLVPDPSGDIEDLAMMVAHRIAHTVSPTDDRDLRQILRARDGEPLKDAARRAAAGDPPQTFHPPISVTVSNAGGMTFAGVAVGDITDPAFLALPMGVRLGLVVLRG